MSFFVRKYNKIRSLLNVPAQIQDLDQRIGFLLDKLCPLSEGVSADLVFCPVCNGMSSYFLDHRGRKNARCKFCNSLERHRLSAVVLKNYFSSSESVNLLNVLHIAPEGAIQPYLKRQAKNKYVTLDLHAPKVDYNCDIAETPFPDGEFDLIYCSHVMEHVPHDVAAFKELYRILGYGGALLIMVPIGEGSTDEDPEKSKTPELCKIHYGQEDHIRRYGLDIVDRIKGAGFSVDVFSSESISLLPFKEKFGFLANDYVFLAKKTEK